jgi:hypothetical protein
MIENLKTEFVDNVKCAVISMVLEKEQQPKPAKTGKRGKPSGQYVTAKEVVKVLGLTDNVFNVLCVNQVVKSIPGYKSVSGCGIMRILPPEETQD